MSETIYFLYIFEEMINQKHGVCYFCFLDQNSVTDYNLQVSARDLLPLRKNERSKFLNKLRNRLVKVKVLVSQSRPILCDSKDCSPPGSCPWNSPGKNTGAVCHSFLQGIFLTQGLNPGLLHCRQFLFFFPSFFFFLSSFCRQFVYCLSHEGSPLSK